MAKAKRDRFGRFMKKRKARAASRRARPRIKKRKMRRPVAAKARRSYGKGIGAIAHGAFQGLMHGSIALGAFLGRGFNRAGFDELVGRYGWNREFGFNPGGLQHTLIAHGTAIGLDYADRKIGTWKLVGKGKILASIGAAVPLIAGLTHGPDTPLNKYRVAMKHAYGYDPIEHTDWITDGGDKRSDFQNGVIAKYALVGASKLLGPHVNKYLPKGFNL